MYFYFDIYIIRNGRGIFVGRRQTEELAEAVCNAHLNQGYVYIPQLRK